MLEKMKSPLCVENKIRIAPPDYSKENLLATFAPQRNLTPEQIFWSIDNNDRKKAETSVPKPLSALTVYSTNLFHACPQVLQKGKEVLSKQKDVTSLKLFHFSKLLKNTLQEFKGLFKMLIFKRKRTRDLRLEYDVRVELEEVKQHYMELFESIHITRASTNEKTSSLLTQIEDLKAQLEWQI
ncbi:hypothetical protein Tco_1344513 [Tanacetum coccineum]